MIGTTTFGTAYRASRALVIGRSAAKRSTSPYAPPYASRMFENVTDPHSDQLFASTATLVYPEPSKRLCAVPQAPQFKPPSHEPPERNPLRTDSSAQAYAPTASTSRAQVSAVRASACFAPFNLYRVGHYRSDRQ